MRHRNQGPKLNRRGAHRKAMGANLAAALLTHGRIQTTAAPKARLARGIAEKAITLAKQDTLHARRQAIALLRDKVLGAELPPRRAARSNASSSSAGGTSFEIIQKAVMAGVALVAAVSAPSSLAIDLARENQRDAARLRSAGSASTSMLPQSGITLRND